MAAGAEVRLSRAAVAQYAEMLRSGANDRFREAATQHLSNAEWPVRAGHVDSAVVRTRGGKPTCCGAA
jgi:hypothetical protein